MSNHIVSDQSNAFDEAVNEAKKNHPSLTKIQDGVIVSLIAGPALGWYLPDPNNNLIWVPAPPAQNQYLKFVVQLESDHRFIPELEAFAELFDIDHHLIERQLPQYFWHPYLYHYGNNWMIPKEGDYLIELFIKMPQFPRLSQSEGQIFTRDIRIKFDPIKLTPDNKSLDQNYY